MDEDFEPQHLDKAAVLAVAENLASWGLELRNSEALEKDVFYEPGSVLWASDDDGVPAFGHTFFFDTEMIYGDNDYPDFINELAAAIEIGDRLTDVSSTLHETSCATIRYCFDNKTRELTFEQPNDWIPDDVLTFLFRDLSEIEGRVRLASFDGQGAMVVWVLPEHVDEFLALHTDFEPWPKCTGIATTPWLLS